MAARIASSWRDSRPAQGGSGHRDQALPKRRKARVEKGNRRRKRAWRDYGTKRGEGVCKRATRRTHPRLTRQPSCHYHETAVHLRPIALGARPVGTGGSLSIRRSGDHITRSHPLNIIGRLPSVPFDGRLYTLTLGRLMLKVLLRLTRADIQMSDKTKLLASTERETSRSVTRGRSPDFGNSDHLERKGLTD